MSSSFTVVHCPSQECSTTAEYFLCLIVIPVGYYRIPRVPGSPCGFPVPVIRARKLIPRSSTSDRPLAISDCYIPPPLARQRPRAYRNQAFRRKIELPGTPPFDLASPVKVSRELTVERNIKSVQVKCPGSSRKSLDQIAASSITRLSHQGPVALLDCIVYSPSINLVVRSETFAHQARSKIYFTSLLDPTTFSSWLTACH